LSVKGERGLIQLKCRHFSGAPTLSEPGLPAAYGEAQILPEGDSGPQCFKSALKDHKVIQNPKDLSCLLTLHVLIRI